MKYITVVNKTNEKVIASKVVEANTFWTRFRGLLGKDELAFGEGLLLYPCSAIHCWGMKFTIDAIFLDREKKVIGLKEIILPGKGARVRGSHYVLEIAVGEIEKNQVKLGDYLSFL